MRRFLVRHLTYANLTATLALFLALGGGAYAAFKLPKNSVGTRQIKNGAVTARKLRAHSLTRQDFASGQLTQGPRGPAGQPGTPGQAGSSRAYAYVNSAGTAQPSFAAGRVKGFASVTKGTDTGIYCLTLAGSGGDASSAAPVVTAVYDSPASPATTQAQLSTGGGCGAGQIVVYTYLSGTGGTWNVSFTLAVP